MSTASEENEYFKGWKRLDIFGRRAMSQNTTHSRNERSKTCAAQAHFDNWIKIARAMSSRRLTYEVDKLSALSGLADTMLKSLPHEKYYAGMWAGDFHHSLLWHSLLWGSEGRLGTQRASNQYIAPTWSWTSHKGEVYWQSRGETSHTSGTSSPCTVLEICTIPSGADALGRLRSGFVRLRGRTRILSSVIERDIDQIWYWGAHDYAYDLCCGEDKIGEGMLDLDDRTALLGELWYFEVDPRRMRGGLILEEVLDAAGMFSGTFRRAGSASLWSEDKELFVPDFLEGLEPMEVCII
jgi:hypothetical protein